jgi:ABC-type uncharacterized transport system substrate-binding protein
MASAPPAAGGEGGPATAPERPWRVIYLEGGPYRDYHLIFRGLLQGLADLNLVEEPPPYEGETEDSAPLWRALAARPGPRLEFLADGFYSAGWNQESLAAAKREILNRLERGEADLVLAFGTAAGAALVDAVNRTPLLIISTTDPVGAGLSRSLEDSGRDNVHVQVVSGVVEYQLVMFHNIFGFATLGVPYDVTPEGRAAMGLATAEKIAAEKGFTIVPCRTELEIADQEKSYRNLKTCLDRLVETSEAIYLPVNNGLQHERMASLLEPVIARQRPSFSQLGPEETRLGVLLSMGETDFLNSGRFEAEVILAILGGAQPRSINQVYLPPLTMALNLKMAQLIGWRPPFEVLAAVDELYNQVAGRD